MALGRTSRRWAVSASLVLAVAVLGWAGPAVGQPDPDQQESDDTPQQAKTWTHGALMSFTVHQDGNLDWTRFTVPSQMRVEFRFNIPQAVNVTDRPGDTPLTEALLVDILREDLTTSVLQPFDHPDASLQGFWGWVTPAPAGQEPWVVSGPNTAGVWSGPWLPYGPAPLPAAPGGPIAQGGWPEYQPPPVTTYASPPGYDPGVIHAPAGVPLTGPWTAVTFRLEVDPGTYYMRVTNDPTYCTFVTQYTVQYVETPPGGLRISEAVPSAWTVHWGARTPPTSISGGMTVHTMLPAGTFISRPYKVTVGLRNAAGIWVGSDPQVVVTDWPVWDREHHFPFRSFRNLRCPQVEGQQYTVWARMTQTTSNLAAINDFKAAVVAAADGSNQPIGAVGAVTTPAAAAAFLGVDPPAFAALGDGRISGRVTFQMGNGANVNEQRKAVVGIRDALGNWVGGEPIVIITDVPPAAPALPRTYSDRPFEKLQAPAVAGAYNLRLRIVAAKHDDEAIRDFKVNVVPVPTPDEMQLAVVNVP